MTNLRQAAQQALEYMKSVGGIDMYPEEWAIVERLEAALSEEALQRLTDVQQEMERNFCPRCGKRTNDIHTCTPPQAEPEGDALTAAYMLGRYDGKRKPLTTEEVEQLWAQSSWQGRANIGFARAIEKAHGIGV